MPSVYVLVTVHVISKSVCVAILSSIYGNAVNVICFQSYELSVPGKEAKLLLSLALVKLSVSNTEHYRISPALIPPFMFSNYHTGGRPMNLSFVAQPNTLQ